MNSVYSVKEVADFLEVDEETVRRWIRSGRLEAELDHGKKGGYKIKRSHLMTFMSINTKYRKFYNDYNCTDESQTSTKNRIDNYIDRLENLIVELREEINILKTIRNERV